MSEKIKSYYNHGDYTTVNGNTVPIPLVEAFDEVKGRSTAALKLMTKHLTTDKAQQDAFFQVVDTLIRRAYFKMLEHKLNFELGRASDDRDEDEEGSRQMTIDDAIRDAQMKANEDFAHDMKEAGEIAQSLQDHGQGSTNEFIGIGGPSKGKKRKADAATIEDN